MHRRPLLEQLAAYSAFNDDDALARERIVDFVRAHDDCFERSLARGHVTGSAWILDEGFTHALLTHHRKLDRWLQLGGHADGDPDTVSVALREAVEESGLSRFTLSMSGIFDVDVHTIPMRGSEPEHLHYDVRYLLEADRGRPLCVSSESKDLAWVALERIVELDADASVLRMVEKTFAL